MGQGEEGALSDSLAPLVETPGPAPLASLLLGRTLFLSSIPGLLLCLLFPEPLQVPLHPGHKVRMYQVPIPGTGVMGFALMPDCPLGTSRKKSRNMWLCQVWSKWACPWALGLTNNLLLLGAKEASQAPCTWCPGPRGLPLGAQSPQGKEPGKGRGELPMLPRAWLPDTFPSCIRLCHQSAFPGDMPPTN